MKIFHPKSSTLHPKPSSLNPTRGFTLIELLVVLAIFIIITSVVLARQNRFSSDILLTDLAYQIAISVREAQVYGLGVQNSAVTNFDTGYGIDFNINNQTTYTFFADINKDKICNGTCVPNDSGSDKILTTYQIQKGGKIFSMCGILSTGSPQCVEGAQPAVDVVYTRPDPAAVITGGGQTYSRLTITVLSSLGDRAKCVLIDQTGQVSVLAPPDPNAPTTCPSS